MKIIEQYAGAPCEVYAMYWSDFSGTMQRYHYVIPEEGYPGFISVPETECELVDPSIKNFVLVKNHNGEDMLMHPALTIESLLDRIVDHDPNAMERFQELISDCT